MEIVLCDATRELIHEYYKGFENDPDIFMDTSRFSSYRYDAIKVDDYYAAKILAPDRKAFMVMCGDEIVGELILKRIDHDKGECELSIHLKNDSVKNKGYGTQAEQLALQYAFEVMGMKTVFADSVLKNSRSQRVLEKVGFRFVKEDDAFKYYRFDREMWCR